LISNDEDNHLAYCHEELLRLASAGHADTIRNKLRDGPGRDRYLPDASAVSHAVSRWFSMIAKGFQSGETVNPS